MAGVVPAIFLSKDFLLSAKHNSEVHLSWQQV